MYPELHVFAICVFTNQLKSAMYILDDLKYFTGPRFFRSVIFNFFSSKKSKRTKSSLPNYLVPNINSKNRIYCGGRSCVNLFYI